MRVEVRDCVGDAVEQDECLARIEARHHSVTGGGHAAAAVAAAAEVKQLLRVSEIEVGLIGKFRFWNIFSREFHRLADLGWVDFDLGSGVPQSALFCLGRWDLGRIGSATWQESGTS